MPNWGQPPPARGWYGTEELGGGRRELRGGHVTLPKPPFCLAVVGYLERSARAGSSLLPGPSRAPLPRPNHPQHRPSPRPAPCAVSLPSPARGAAGAPRQAKEPLPPCSAGRAPPCPRRTPPSTPPSSPSWAPRLPWSSAVRRARPHTRGGPRGAGGALWGRGGGGLASCPTGSAGAAPAEPPGGVGATPPQHLPGAPTRGCGGRTDRPPLPGLRQVLPPPPGRSASAASASVRRLPRCRIRALAAAEGPPG